MVEFVVMLNDHGIFEIKSASVSFAYYPVVKHGLTNPVLRMTSYHDIIYNYVYSGFD